MEGTRTKDDAGSRAQLPVMPPGIQPAARTKNRTKTWRTEEVQSDDQTIPQRNQIQTATRNMAANKIDITTGEVWIELQQGSPRAAMDVGATCSGEWPGDREITATVRNAMADNVADRIHRRQVQQMAERAEGDPWRRYGGTEDGARARGTDNDDSRITHAASVHRLVQVPERALISTNPTEANTRTTAYRTPSVPDNFRSIYCPKAPCERIW